MTVLFLRRQTLGGIATYSSALAQALEKHGVEVRIENAEKWIPNETGPKPDAKVTPQLEKLAKDVQIVHAFGYRPAWACGAAFKSYSAWVYTAYDMPKTTHQLLIDKLNEAQAGICSSRAVFRALDEAIAIDLVIDRPGIPPSSEWLVSEEGGRGVEHVIPREEAKQRLGLPVDSTAILALGRLVPERGFDALIKAMDTVWQEHPRAHLVIGGTGPSMDELKSLANQAAKASRVKLAGHVGDVGQFLSAADLVVVPSRRAGTSMVALEAMSLGLPVLLRDIGGLPELIDPDISGMLFQGDDDLASTINEMLGLPLTLQTLGSAAKVRSEEHFSMEQHAESIAKLYKSVLE